MTAFPYHLSEETLPRLGLVVLQTDETLEQDMRRLFTPETVNVHITRIPSGLEVTPETLGAMREALPAATALLPPGLHFDAIGYGCTSATAHLGEETVTSLIRAGANASAVTNPLTATLAACRALGVVRVGLISPYIDSVASQLATAFERGGLELPQTVSFGEENEARVARISPASLHEAALELHQRGSFDALFLSCTNLRTLDVIADLEARLGIPILSSNLTLAWHMAQLGGVSIHRTVLNSRLLSATRLAA